MVNPLRIAVLVHEHDDFARGGYLMRRLCDEWERRGAKTFVVKGARAPLPDADLALLHTDVTRIGSEYDEVLAHYPRVINGRVTDISKRVISDLTLAQGDAYAGPVIVKTNANFGGLREATLSRRTTMLQNQRVTWRDARCLTNYPVYAGMGRVPEGVWQNPHLVVEKFLPERNVGDSQVDGGSEGASRADEYVLRVWVFLGDRSIHYRCISRFPVVKGANTLRREGLDVDAVPPELRAKRAELGFDYGKFDYALVQGKAVLYDANRTPGTPSTQGAANQGWAQRSEERLRSLSEGLSGFLEPGEVRAP